MCECDVGGLSGVASVMRDPMQYAQKWAVGPLCGVQLKYIHTTHSSDEEEETEQDAIGSWEELKVKSEAWHYIQGRGEEKENGDETGASECEARKPMSVPQPRHNHQMVLMPACLLKDKRALQAHAQLTPQAPILTQGSGGCEWVRLWAEQTSTERWRSSDQTQFRPTPHSTVPSIIGRWFGVDWFEPLAGGELRGNQLTLVVVLPA